MKKRTKEIIVGLPLIAIALFTFVSYTIPPTIQLEDPQTFSGLFVEYKGKMIGGEIQGNIIILDNGTKLGLDEFKKITGYKGP